MDQTSGRRTPHPAGALRLSGALLLLAILPLGLLLLPLQIAGNGGMLRLANLTMGEYRVSVYTDPTPVRPDTLDVSILLIQEGVEGVPEGVEILVRSRPLRGSGAQQELRATRELADDPRYHAAKFGLGAEGPWEIEIEVNGEAGRGSATFEVIAREPGLLGHPAVVVLLILLPLGLAGWWLLRMERREAGSGSG